MKSKPYLLWFKEVDKEDGALVGGKGANLGEMASFDIPVPSGFMVTSHAYDSFLEKNNLPAKIKEHLKDVKVSDPQTFAEASARIKSLIKKGEIPTEISQEIINYYLKMGGTFKHALVAVRSSATAEDLPDASFAGQQATYLNVRGEANVVEAVKNCWASLFEPRAIFYREEKGFDHLKVKMAVPVQEMIPAFVSGVMFTIDPVTDDKQTLIIEAIYGLGELIVQGKVTPDQHLVDKKSLKIIQSTQAEQTIQLIKVGASNKETRLPVRLRKKRKLTDAQVKALAKLGIKIQKHYYFPQDIEWALDKKGKLWILQTRPVTTIGKGQEAKNTQAEEAAKTGGKKLLIKGVAASPGLVAGPVQLMKNARELKKVKKGDVLVTSMTTPDFVPAMKQAVAIVTNKGGQTSHAAIVSRELGIPCVVGTKTATKKLKNGQIVTVNGRTGEIFDGGFKAKDSRTLSPAAKLFGKKKKTTRIFKTATKIYVNLAEPELAAQVAQQNVDGVGLLRAEFMMAEIGVHPKKIIRDKRKKEFVDQLTEKLAVFCREFQPRPVVYRATDFKTNEYRNLVGGKGFEPEEENPMLGYRGAFRYLNDPEVFELELKAIRQVRNKLNLKNLWLMVPFCRTPKELAEVKKLIAASGLIRSPSFKLWLMVEIPANVVLLEEFIKVGIDGVSIGSNDLTMLMLGVDRDNAELGPKFNETDPAVLWALEKTIRTCQKAKITASICGQAPSVYADLVEKLVEWGITSLSLNPDALDRTRQMVYEIEKRLAIRSHAKN